ncbi:cytochrome c [Polaromonas sp. YR568]|uniref:c-type cytochrome n=1 Tax=Polaromonas sp. YR568 TaxID=1855301 RepID=UPI00313836FD
MKRLLKWLAGLSVAAGVLAAVVWTLNIQDEVDVNAPVAAAAPSEQQIARGAYLARAGNCAGCHTAPGGADYAGGKGIPTPFGTVFTSNLTPDDKTGIGSWSPAHFWRAMHNGRSKDGRLLYPAFPYTNYTQVTREDSDALFAYLGSLPPVVQPNQPHGLQFPFQSQAALAVWRALYFRPGVFEADTRQSMEWNRGAYLVQGLGHCSACHSARNALGATTQGLNLAGGLIPMQNWYAPSLSSPQEAGVAGWREADIVSLLQHGVSPQASVAGPMAEVVLRSTQHLSASDLGAMAKYLQQLPGTPVATAPQPAAAKVTPGTAAKGAKLYEQHCAQCHGASGEGVPKAYPALAGNRAVTMTQTVNLVQIVLAGGYAPATEGNPRPFGMPPFVLVMNDEDIATVLTHIRNAWGNQASEVTPIEVNRIRANSAR